MTMVQQYLVSARAAKSDERARIIGEFIDHVRSRTDVEIVSTMGAPPTYLAIRVEPEMVAKLEKERSGDIMIEPDAPLAYS
jgi:hypothetical protein